MSKYKQNKIDVSDIDPDKIEQVVDCPVCEKPLIFYEGGTFNIGADLEYMHRVRHVLKEE